MDVFLIETSATINTQGLGEIFKLQSLGLCYIKAIAVRRRTAAALDFIITGQHMLQIALFGVALSTLVFARQAGPMVTATKVKAAFGAASWLNAEAAITEAGPTLAPIIFTAITTVAAVIPFVPTQPLFIMAGLFFGSTYGAALGLLAVVSATILAAFGSRTRGYRQFSDDVAQRVGGAPARRSVRGAVAKGEPSRQRPRQSRRASHQGGRAAPPPTLHSRSPTTSWD